MDASPPDSDTSHQTTADGEVLEEDELGGPQVEYQGFEPLAGPLRSVLLHCQYENEALRCESSMARVFGVPLLVDALSVKVTDLLSASQPHVIGADASVIVEWTDLIHQADFQPQLQGNGLYHCRIKKNNALVVISQWDHDLIATRRQIMYSMTYPCDLSAEKNALDLISKAITSWNVIALESESICLDNLEVHLLMRHEVLEINRASLVLIDQKLRDIQKQFGRPAGDRLILESESSVNEPNEPDSASRPDKPSFSTSEDLVTTEASDGSHFLSQMHEETPTNRVSPNGRRWPRKHIQILPGWFRANSHLEKEDIEKAFIAKFGHIRSFDAIQIASRRASESRGARRGRSKKSARNEAARLRHQE